MTLTEAAPQRIQVGILTKGRPMLAIVIANLVLQEEYPIEIFVVDTGDEPAIKRVDVVSVLRLAQDRNVRCEYELHRDRNRAFSSGRLKLLENLNGPLVAFMDERAEPNREAVGPEHRRAPFADPDLQRTRQLRPRGDRGRIRRPAYHGQRAWDRSRDR